MNILILGMPNAGKSSLFNLITSNNNNIIHSSIGTTRDWHIGHLKNNININIYDTPGVIINKKSHLDIKYKNFINKINIFLYVIDYKKENYILDKELINIIRKFNKQIILIINKDDNLDKDLNLDKFGIENFFYISCSHKLGFENFLDYLGQYNSSNIISQNYDFSIGLFGKTNVGKSTLFNELVGFDRSTVSDKPKTTTDTVASSYKYKGIKYLIKDTAGLIKKNKIDKDSLDYFATKKTLSIIKEIDINLFLIDVQQGFDTQSRKIFNLIYKNSNLVILLINKIDLIKKDKNKTILNIKNEILDNFSQSKNIFIFPLSNYYKKDLINLKKYIHKLTFEVKKNISTSKMNSWLQNSTTNNPHTRIKGKEVKFKYATQISDNPLTIKIFSNFSKEITSDYRRYLLNKFYKYFKIKSKNVKIIFSKTSNPYN